MSVAEIVTPKKTTTFKKKDEQEKTTKTYDVDNTMVEPGRYDQASDWSLSHEEDLGSTDKNPFLEMSQDQIQKLDAVLSSEQAQKILGESSTQFGLQEAQQSTSQKLGFVIGTDSTADTSGLERTIEDSLRYIMNGNSLGIKTDDFLHAFGSSTGSIHVAGSDLLVGDVEVEMATEEILIEEEVVSSSSQLDLDYARRCIVLDHDYCMVPEPIEVQEVEAVKTEAILVSDDFNLPDEAQLPGSDRSELVSSPIRRSQRQIEKFEREQVEKIKAENVEMLRREIEEAEMLLTQKHLEDVHERECDVDKLEDLGAGGEDCVGDGTEAEVLEGESCKTEVKEELAEIIKKKASEPIAKAVVPWMVPIEMTGYPKVELQESPSDTEKVTSHDIEKVDAAAVCAPNTRSVLSELPVSVSADLTSTIVTQSDEVPANLHGSSAKTISLVELKDSAFFAAPPQQLFACDGDSSSDQIPDDSFTLLASSSFGGSNLSGLASVSTSEGFDLASQWTGVSNQSSGVLVRPSFSGPGEVDETRLGSSIELAKEVPSHLQRRLSTTSNKSLESILQNESGKESFSSPPSGEKPPGTPTRKSYPKRENRKPPGRLMDMLEPALFSKPDRLKKVDQRMLDEISRPKLSPEKIQSGNSILLSRTTSTEFGSCRSQITKKTDDIDDYLSSVESISDFGGSGDLVIVEEQESSSVCEVSVEATPQLRKEKSILKDRPGHKVRPSFAKKDARKFDNKRGLNKLSKQKMRTKKGAAGAGSRKTVNSGQGEGDENSDDDDDEDSSDWCSEDDPDRLWCICKQPHNDRFMIRCDGCEEWFHGSCVGVTRKQGRELEKSGKEWVCSKCTKGRTHSKDVKCHIKGTELKSEKFPVDDKCASKSLKVAAVERSRVVSSGVRQDAADAKQVKKPVKVVRGVPRILKSNPPSKLCIVGCGRTSRADSIYCGVECIQKHATDSLQVIDREKEKKEMLKLSRPESIVRKEPVNVEHITVLERRTGRILAGPNAPTVYNLHDWLKRNPTFEVASINKTDSPRKNFYGSLQRDPPKTIKLINAKPMPVELPAKENPRSKAPTPEKKPQIPIVASSSTLLIEKKTPVMEKKLPVVEKKLPVVERKPVLVEKKVVIPELKVALPDKKEVKLAPAPPTTPPATSTPPVPRPTPGPEPVRLNVRKSLKDILTMRSNDADDLLLSSDEIKKIAVNIEEELFRFFNDTGAKYKSKYRSLMFNIKDQRNHGLFRKILRGKVAPYKLVRMTPEELASKELAMWRERETKHTLEMIKREQEEQQQHIPIIKKTHKGEIEIDDNDLGFTDKTKGKPEGAVEVVSNMLVDTTDAHRSHLFDLNCKICTGKMLPPTESDVPVKGVRVAKSISIESKSQDEDEELSDVPPPPPPRSDKKTEKKSKSVNTKNEIKAGEKKSSMKKNQKPKEKEVVKAKKKVKIIKVSKSSSASKEFKSIKSCLSSSSFSSDKKNSSKVNVTSNSPDSAVSSQTDSETKTVPSVWKGFIMMQDVTKFVTSAHKVSGPTELIGQDIPDTIQVCGRIKPNMVWDYLSKMKQSTSKEIIVIRFSPSNDEEKVAYVSFYSYLSSRNRFGVVANSAKMIKDFYILPLSSNSPVPSTLLPFDGPGFDEPRPHMLLGVIIKHIGKRKSVGDSATRKNSKKKKKSSTPVDSTDQSSSEMSAKNTTSTKKVKFNLSANAVASLEEDEPYEPSYTPPLVGRKGTSGNEASTYERSFTPPLPSEAGGNESPYDPIDEEDADKPYDPEEAEEAVKVSKSIIPGLLQGSMSSKTVSELIEQISMSSNPTGMTSTVLASIATATNLDQQRKLLLELTQKVEEQKRQLEMQKQQIATKVTQQVMGVMNPYTLTAPTVPLNVLASTSASVGLGLAPPTATRLAMASSTGTESFESKLNDGDEAYSPSYTPPPPPIELDASSGTMTSMSSTRLPNTSGISLPANLQEILESIKKKGTMLDGGYPAPMGSFSSTVSTDSSELGLVPSQSGNVMLEDPIVKNFLTVTEGKAEDVETKDSSPESDVVTTNDSDETSNSSLAKQTQSDPRLKGKALPIDPRVKPQDAQKKSELRSLSASELMEKALKQFQDLPAKEFQATATAQLSLNQALSSGKNEPLPLGIENCADNAQTLQSGVPMVIYPFTKTSQLVAPVPPPVFGIPVPRFGPPPPPAIFPAYRSSFPTMASGMRATYWTERGRKEWRGPHNPRVQGGRGKWQGTAAARGDWERCSSPSSSSSQPSEWSPREKTERKEWDRRGDQDEWDRRGDRDEWNRRSDRDDTDRNRRDDRDGFDRERRGDREDFDRDRRADRDDFDRDRRDDLDRDRRGGVESDDWDRGRRFTDREDSDRDRRGRDNRDRYRDRDRREERRDRHERERSREKERDRDKDRDRDRSRSRH